MVINETSIIVNTLLKLEVHQEDIWVIIFIYRNSSVLSLNESRYSITSLNNTTPLMVDKKFTSEVDLRRGGSRDLSYTSYIERSVIEIMLESMRKIGNIFHVNYKIHKHAIYSI